MNSPRSSLNSLRLTISQCLIRLGEVLVEENKYNRKRYVKLDSSVSS